jgi:hypothetical protein
VEAGNYTTAPAPPPGSARRDKKEWPQTLGNLQVHFGGPGTHRAGSASWWPWYHLYTVPSHRDSAMLNRIADAQQQGAPTERECDASVKPRDTTSRGVFNAKVFATPFEASLNETMATCSAELMDSPSPLQVDSAA